MSAANEKDDDGMNLKKDAVIAGNNGEYTIIKLLGEGGFGAVYCVKATDGNEYAMKVEKKLLKRKHSKLKMEVAILKLVGEEKETVHFTKIIDRGKKEQYFFLVMELVGPSLDDMKRTRPHKVFSLPTGLKAGIQCLKAVAALHKHGFIHRDLKPANYARGLNDKRTVVYLLDFGIARCYKNMAGDIKTPRSSVPFKGTVRFASRSCHRNKELGPKDDCESWFYLLLDLIIETGLPWKKFADRDKVIQCKDEMRENESRRKNSLFYNIKHTDYFDKVLEYLDSRTYADKIDYEFLYEAVTLTGVRCGANMDAPYDWDKDSATRTSTTQATVTTGGNNKTKKSSKSTQSSNQRTTKTNKQSRQCSSSEVSPQSD
ncbi:unnamed protein product [Bursaphelenchus okinawaensis]|uniref:Protein kinase domain-containing protein n=1 Tax=Bursaphelenchus okinawaensis TaxID=465554 RepID=A0A811LRG3_9BILA|nr:unnamed protein product [Bursaphelenchus okinawaensis]CAG9127377.1 unnamed protein product [Bursaphelenchus okinawaensis]